MVAVALPNYLRYVVPKDDDRHEIQLLVEGAHCASCIWQIENALAVYPGVYARMNFSTRRLTLRWQGNASMAQELIAVIAALGYRLLPFDANALHAGHAQEENFLLRCLAVAAFGSGNIMLLSFALWFTDPSTIGEATKALLHWLSALIALPTIIYAGQPFYQSAWRALRHGRSNMDVPIAVAIILAGAMSLFETIRHGPYVYFDSAVMLVFLLLIGRYLDKKARGRARQAAQDLLEMLQGTATVMIAGATQILFARDLSPGMIMQVAAGERIAADGMVKSGTSEVDNSLITGESLPQKITPGSRVFAGTLNLGQPITVEITQASPNSMLANIIQLMESAEQAQAKYVRLADRVAGYYTPVVHVLALMALIGWVVVGLPWQQALMIATTVLIITCPCALGLAVPAVQVIASQHLFRRGILLKSGDALERLARVDTVVFDKTGTLTIGKPRLINKHSISPDALQLAASLALHSRHPLARAVHAAWEGAILPLAAQEITGCGMLARQDGRDVKLGKAEWCSLSDTTAQDGMEIFLVRDGHAPVRFVFADELRRDAVATVQTIWRKGYRLLMISGDRASIVQSMSETLGIPDSRAELTPVEKTALIKELGHAGRKLLMVGDGLNDAAALAAANVSMSPSSAIDIAQNAADIVFQGDGLSPVVTAIDAAKQADRLVKQNFALSMLYNVIAVPLALAGMVTPVWAALAMSSSSLLVIGNALRLRLKQ